MRVVHIIGTLGFGGAEQMLKRLVLAHRDSASAESLIITLLDSGVFQKELEELGIPVIAVGLKGLFSLPLVLIRIVRILRDFNPSIVQTWLYHADLIGGIAARLAGIKVVIWNIRCTAHGDSKITKMLMISNAALSYFIPTSIICCGTEARLYHQRLKFNERRMKVLPNGVDLTQFSPGKKKLRSSGCHFAAIGRANILKDHRTFIKAAGLAAKSHPELTFSIHGKGVPEQLEYIKLISDFELEERMTLHDATSNMSELLQNVDIFCSSSTSEGFPNVIAEAMAMKIPCIATDAGDSRNIVGDTGIIVSVGDSAAMSAAMIDFYKLGPQGRDTLGIKARRRIFNDFEMNHVASLYLFHYKRLTEKNIHA
jgi:glycosyltransferase involved in cell wall biosynthesis